MLIVAGHLTVAATQREAYLAGCERVVEHARQMPGCLDFAISADRVDPQRINVFERWRSRTELEAFRGDGPDDAASGALLGAAVAEYDVAAERSLTGADLE